MCYRRKREEESVMGVCFCLQVCGDHSTETQCGELESPTAVGLEGGRPRSSSLYVLVLYSLL